MPKKNVVIVRTGTANLASVVAAFKRLNTRALLTDDRKTVARAKLLVLPGVGTFAAAMARLREAGLVDILRERLIEERPTLAICLGLQLLGERSEESKGVGGLGIVPGTASRFPGDLRVPQLGWNRILSPRGARYLDSGYYYFANSYRLVEPPPGWHIATADYGGSFVAAMERGPVLACQFHPELSAKSGIALIERWLCLNMNKGGEAC